MGLRVLKVTEEIQDPLEQREKQELEDLQAHLEGEGCLDRGEREASKALEGHVDLKALLERAWNRSALHLAWACSLVGLFLPQDSL